MAAVGMLALIKIDICCLNVTFVRSNVTVDEGSSDGGKAFEVVDTLNPIRI